jgi:5-methyltetrahydrofolate--homocysteine methyltransferase
MDKVSADKFSGLLAEKGVILADGATGTNYFTLGLETGHPPEFWNIERPQDVRNLHRRFLEAGSDLILTNSFGGTRYRLKLHAAEARVNELNTAAARLARQAVSELQDKAGRDALVAGSMGPTGELFAPLGELDHESAVAAFTEQAEALAEGGVDLLWIETISSLEEVDAAMNAAKAVGLPFAATMTFDTAGKSMMGVEPKDYARHAHEGGATAVGANCGVGPAELMHSVMGMRDVDGVRLIAKGNCGIPEYRDGSIHYHGSPELMAKYAVLARDAGMAVIGGCCGTTPEHISAMRRALDETPPQGPADKARLEAELGPAWAGIADQKECRSGQGARRGRRRR